MTTETPNFDNIGPRNCGNCACSAMQPNHINPLEKQMFCRRNPPMAQELAVDVQQVRDGKPQFARDGKTPITHREKKMFYLFPPTMAELVCFDGWRPLGTEPGQRVIEDLDGMTGALKRLWADMIAQLQSEALPQPEDFNIASMPSMPIHIAPNGDTHEGPKSDCDLCNGS